MTKFVRICVCATALVVKGSGLLSEPRELNVAGAHGAYGYDHVTNGARNLGQVVGITEWSDCTSYSPAQGGCAPSSTRCWQLSLSSAQKICDAHQECVGVTRDNCGFEPRKGALYHHVAAHEAWIKQLEYSPIRKDGRALNYHGVKGTSSWNDCTQYSPAGGSCAPNEHRCWQQDLASAQRICNAHSECTGITRDNCGFEPRTGGRTDHVAAHEAWEKLNGVGLNPSGEEVQCPKETTFSQQGFCYDSHGQSCKLPWADAAHMKDWAFCDDCTTVQPRGPMRCTRTIQWW
mmetsp:Transcript_18089/g.30801  ORF Transcript_18089/g.30801 Transcript_18089/m.30801 type:complete len:290 (+) Transcript_18089:186-1055(+)